MPPDEPVWLPNSVSKHFFVEAYKADASNRALQTEHEYLSWVRRFYNGSDIYPQGWKAMERMVLGGIDALTHAEAAATLQRLGKLIAASWAKDNRVRLITTAMLVIWVHVMQSAVGDTGPAAIDQIRQDVDALLTARLPPEAIKAQRYAKWLGEAEPSPFDSD